MIAETPNILIVHLQRIGFNFETFETDKFNTLCKFPTMLDLKPYSYFEVMNKEESVEEVDADVDCVFVSVIPIVLPLPLYTNILMAP